MKGDSKNRRLSRATANVFADLGLPDADELLVKAQLSLIIVREIRERGWTQEEAAERLGLAQPDVSNIKRGKLENFAQGRLQNVLRRLNIDVNIHIHRRSDNRLGIVRVLETA